MKLEHIVLTFIISILIIIDVDSITPHMSRKRLEKWNLALK